MAFIECSSCTDGTFKKTGIKFQKGNTVKVRIDETKCCICFGTNYRNLREVAKVNRSTKPYYFAVSTNLHGTTFSMANYSCSNVKDIEDAKEIEHEVFTYCHSSCSA